MSLEQGLSFPAAEELSTDLRRLATVAAFFVSLDADELSVSPCNSEVSARVQLQMLCACCM